ncbi:unnamed protein product [Urochloa decumbens]|uniref:F-box domain-containing protein n=1 Tax=Urochloa decumbens TaxID=240449 RepID=A0ABC9A1I7_9POAL
MDPEPLIGMSMGNMRAYLGRDGDNLEMGTNMLLQHTYYTLPYPPVSRAAPLALAAAAAACAPADGVDRISGLPDVVLRNIVSRLPAKDAARTSVLASRWRGLWRSAPLALVDAHLLPAVVLRERCLDRDSPGVAAAVSRALAAHPGPFRCVHLTRCKMDAHRAEIERWIQLLAAKGVEELVFVNRPWPLNLPLPAALFSCTTLTRLYIGVWRLPRTAALPRAAGFPHLRELGLSMVFMEDRDLAFLIDRCPVLEILVIFCSKTPVHLRLISRSLRCVQIGFSYFTDISVVDAPCLERLLMWVTWSDSEDDKRPRIKIGHAPKLHVMGYFQPEMCELEIGSTIIKAGIKATAGTIVPSINVMAMEVRFEVRNEVKMLPSFLKCFPNIKTLHIRSEKADEATGKVNLKFWQEAGPIECVQCHIKELIFHEFRGSRSEFAFLKFIAERAQVLEKMVIVVAYACLSLENLNDKLKSLASAQWASKGCRVQVFKSPLTQGGGPGYNTHIGSDFSCADPFDLLS